jgi:asparagine synthase (glutamine-hydrolysing)
MAKHLETNHYMHECSLDDIGKALPEVIYHAVVPMLRTAPIPLYLLSKQVRKNGMKVVLTGEGSDEFLLGYDIFREARIRRFWARHPDWKVARGLINKVHKYLDTPTQADFFAIGMENTTDSFYSHRPRWHNSTKIKRFLSEETKKKLDGYQSLDVLASTLPEEYHHWHYLAQSQHLEINTFLSTYLLSTQGDRVAMANSVEGRFPFLDYRVVAYCNKMPPEMKLYGLNEKWILKKMAQTLVPPEILARVKKPFRAPIKKVFESAEARSYVEELLSPRKVAETGVFNPSMVQKLWEKTQKMGWLGEVDQMTLMAVVTFQLWHTTFIENSARLDQKYVENIEIREVI